jgi:O-antigen ligase
LLGVAAGVLTFGVIGAIWLNRKTFVTAVGVVVAGLVIALVISLIPDGDAGAVSRNLEDLGDIFDNEQATSIGRRVTIWEGALELAGSWERSPAESTLRHAMRPIFGLGPDMYFYSYPLSVDNDPTQDGLFFAHVHNYPMQVLLEMGLLGLTSFLALALLVVYAALAVLRAEKGAGREGGLIAIFMAALLAALVGRAVEQMSGVANVGDLLTFWAIAGLVIALAVMSRLSAVETIPERSARARLLEVYPLTLRW